MPESWPAPDAAHEHGSLIVERSRRLRQQSRFLLLQVYQLRCRSKDLRTVAMFRKQTRFVPSSTERRRLALVS